MNKRHYTLMLLICLGLFCSNAATAAFRIKKAPVENTTTASPSQAAPAEPQASSGTATGEAHENTVTNHRHSFVSQLFHKLLKPAAAVPQILYIILAIFPLGWLAMGLNDNFKGNDWLISLVLYILGWLPGIIYTLIMMKKYY